MAFRVLPVRSMCRALLAFAYLACAYLAGGGCQVDNPAYDPPVTAGADAVSDASDPGADASSPGTLPRDAEPPGGKDAAAPDGGGPAVRIRGCPADPDLALCLLFEDALIDGSPHGHALSGLGVFGDGPEDRVLDVAGGGFVTTGAEATFVSTKLTVEAWVRLASFPLAGSETLVAVPGVMSMEVTGQGDFVCTVGEERSEARGVLKLGEWTALACTYDGFDLRLFQDGFTRGSRNVRDVVPAVTSARAFVGLGTPGGRLSGVIDNVRIWRRRVVPSALCASALACASP
ncbi:MAG: LamG domain-containing protein [Myxococcales bacterium]|nr:LamG domain-containing protein [Myxococcales bacterium]